MNLSHSQASTLSCFSAVKNRKRKRIQENVSSNIPLKRLYFSPPTHHQIWSMSNSIIHYLTKNPSTSKLYLKLIRTCKYFFFKNPIIVFAKLIYIHQGNDALYNGLTDILLIEENEVQSPIDFNNSLFSKLWITDRIDINTDDSKRNLVSSIISHIYRCDAIVLKLWKQDISFNEYIFLAKNAQRIYFKVVTIKQDVGNTPNILERLFEIAVNVKIFVAVFVNNDYGVTSETFKNLLKIPHFFTVNIFALSWIPETFDIETWYTYMKKNKKTLFVLGFSQHVPQEYKNRLEEIVDEIIETKKHHYKPPRIGFMGLDEGKSGKLTKISKSCYKRKP